MTTASTSAMTTRIGNSRQNDRFLRLRRPAVPRPPAPDPAGSEPAAAASEAFPPSGDASALAGSEAPSALAGPEAPSAVPCAAGPSGLPSEAFPSAGSPDVWDPLSGLTGWPWPGTADAALLAKPASGSAPGVTPRPAPLIRAPSD